MRSLENVDILKILREFKDGDMSDADALSAIVTGAITGAYKKIVSLENSPEYKAGIPISDLYENQVLLPWGVLIDE